MESERVASLLPWDNSGDALRRLGAVFSIIKREIVGCLDFFKEIYHIQPCLPSPAAHQVQNLQVSSKGDVFFTSLKSPAGT